MTAPVGGAGPLPGSRVLPPSEPCPCGSGRGYGMCCGPVHVSGDAETAEALMRSRYSAFRLGLEEHLRRSWHPSARPTVLDLHDGTVWRRLQIVDTVGGGPGDERGIVEFRASYRDEDGAGVLHERSRFVREDGRWSYLDGELLQD